MLMLIDSGDDGLMQAAALTAKVLDGGRYRGTTALSQHEAAGAASGAPADARLALLSNCIMPRRDARLCVFAPRRIPTPLPRSGSCRASDEFRIPPVWYEQPVYYKCNRFSVIGPEADILWPSYSKFVDYELEYGIVIGKRGKNIKQADAKAHIFGFCIFNDVSARDAQYKEYPARLGPAKGKDFDTRQCAWPLARDKG